MVRKMAEETLRGPAAAQFRQGRAPNFVGGTGDPNQPGVPTEVQPGTGGTPAAGGGGGGGPATPPKPRTRLGQVTDGGPEGGGTRDNRAGDRNVTPEGTERERDKFRRGRADLSFGNVAKGLAFGLGVGPLTPASIVANEAVEALTGEDLGMGLPDYEGFIAPDQSIQNQIGQPGMETANQAYAAQDAMTAGATGGGAGRENEPRSRSDNSYGGDYNDPSGINSNSGPTGVGSGGVFAKGGTVTAATRRPMPPGGAVDSPVSLLMQERNRYEQEGFDPYEFVGDMAGEIMKRPPQTWTPEERSIMQEFQNMGGQMPQMGHQRQMIERAEPRPQPQGQPTAGMDFLRAAPQGANFNQGGTVPGRSFQGAGPKPAPRPMPGGGMNPRLQRPMMPMRQERDVGRAGYNAGGVVRGQMEGRMAYAAGGPVIDPASVPDNGVVDDVPINADEGEFVITRDAAVALGPEVLSVINDPQMAPLVAQCISEALGGGAQNGPVLDAAAAPAGPPPVGGPPVGGPPRSRLANIG